MPAYNRALAAAMTLLFTPLASAQTSHLNQVVEHALLTNPEIQMRFHDFKSAEEGKNVVRGGYLPQLNAQGSLGREYRSNIPGESSYSWSRPNYSIELRQLLFDGFRTSNDVKQAGYEKLARYYDLLATTDETAFAAAQAYIDLQRYREMEALARSNYALHDETLKLIRERTASGVGRRVDLEQASGRLALAQANLMTETANLIDVEQRYRRIVGRAPASDLAPAPSVADRLPVQPENFHDALRRNPSFLSKQAELQAANSGIASAKGAFSPRLEFVAATGRDREQPGAQYRNVQNSSVAVVMSYNLYRGGSDAARVRQTAAQSNAARDLRDYTCRNVQQDLAVAWNNITRLREQIPFLTEHELATSKVREAYRQQFGIGERSLLDLLDTENELFESRRALTNATYDLEVAQYRWLSLSHSLLAALSLSPDNLEAPDENSALETSDELLQLCESDIPDSSGLAPVRVQYSEGFLPPTLLPADRPADGAPAHRH